MNSSTMEQMKAEDFLERMDFVLWCMGLETDTEEASWQNYPQNYPQNRKAFLDAVRIVKTVRLGDERMSEEEKSALFMRIMDSFDRIRKKRRRVRRIAAWAGGVAASVLAVCMVVGGSNLWRGDEPVNIYGDIARMMKDCEDISLYSDDDVRRSDKEVVQIDCSSEGWVNISGDQNGRREFRRKIPVKTNVLVVPAGRRAFVTLADGTRMWVNSGSVLEFPSRFEGGERRVKMSGEVYVEAAKDPQRPFYVECRDITTKVLGTSFNVRAYDDDRDGSCSVVLVEGRVEVSVGGETVLLKPGEKLSFSDGCYSVLEVSTERYTSWKDGLLLFSTSSLGEVLDRIADYYHLEVSCPEELSNRSCSGKLILFDDLNATLEIIKALYPVHCICSEGRVSIIERNENIATKPN